MATVEQRQETAEQREQQRSAERSYATVRMLSAVIVLLACWQIVSPWVFGYFTDINAMLNSVVVGVVIVLLATARMATPMRSIGSTGLNLLLGCWVIASPWIWGFAHLLNARWDCMATGFVIAVLAGVSGGATRRRAQRVRVPTTPAPP